MLLVWVYESLLLLLNAECYCWVQRGWGSGAGVWGISLSAKTHGEKFVKEEEVSPVRSGF